MELLLYSPKRPVVDYSVVFLWLMAVGTIIVASFWSKITAPEKSDENYNELAEKVCTCKPQFTVFTLLVCSLNAFLVHMS